MEENIYFKTARNSLLSPTNGTSYRTAFTTTVEHLLRVRDEMYSLKSFTVY